MVKARMTCSRKRTRVATSANVACLAAILLVMVSTGFSASLARAEQPDNGKSYVGSQAGDFTLPDIDGKQVSLSDFRGETVLLSFWATWCPPCKEELPTIQKIYTQDKEKDVVVLAVANEKRTAVASYLKDKHYDFTALLDLKGKLFRRFDVAFIPTVFVINKQGIIVREIVGWRGSQAVLAAVKAGEHSSGEERYMPQGSPMSGNNQ